MAAQKGDEILVTWGGNVIEGQTSGELNFERDSIEVTSKDSGGVKAYIQGDRGATLSLECIYDQTVSNEPFSALFTDWKTDGTVTFQFGETDSGEKYYTGSGFITSLSVSAPQNDKGTFSMEIQVTGDITEATVA